MRHFPLGGVESAAKKELSGFAKNLGSPELKK
jgi:hypothetical protein